MSPGRSIYDEFVELYKARFPSKHELGCTKFAGLSIDHLNEEHDQRTPSFSAERYLTRWHVPQEGHKELQSMHHARREPRIRPRPFLALDDGLQGSATDLTIGSSSCRATWNRPSLSDTALSLSSCFPFDEGSISAASPSGALRMLLLQPSCLTEAFRPRADSPLLSGHLTSRRIHPLL